MNGKKYEAPKKKRVEREGESASVESISRREFLKRGVGTLAFAFLAGTFFSKDIERAWSREVAEENSWTEGLHKLRRETLDAYEERFAFYITHKDGASAWDNGWGESGGTSALIPHDSIDEIVKKEPLEIVVAHTHPVVGAYYIRAISSEESKAIRSSEDPHLSIPPSFQDIISAIGFQSRYKETSVSIKNAVVDPYGVWRLEVDIQSRFAHDVLQKRESFEKLFRALAENKSVNDFISGSSEFFVSRPGTKEGFVSFVHRHGINHIDNVAKETLLAILKVIDDFDVKYKDIKQSIDEKAVAYVKKSAYTPPQKKETDDMAGEYVKIGARVVFEPFEKM